MIPVRSNSQNLQLPAFGGIQSNGLGYSADNQNDAFLDIS